MVPLTDLWLPILVSALFVFIASFLLHTVIAAWHRGDYAKASTEAALLDGIKSLKSDQYVVPLCDWKSMTPEQRKEAMSGPMAFMIVRNPPAGFGQTLGIWFVHCLIVSTFVAYLAGTVLPAGAEYMRVHRIAGTAAVMAWALGPAVESIWFGRPWRITIRHVIDGVIYGLLTGGTFGWLWPA